MRLEPHTVKSFDDELKKLSATLINMGTIIRQLIAITQTMLNMDGPARQPLATEAANLKRELVSLDRVAESQATMIIALRQPAADDLRFVISSFRMAAWLSRMGAHARNAARRISKLTQPLPEKADALMRNMIETVDNMTAQIIEALADNTVIQPEHLKEQETQVDKWYKKAVTSTHEAMDLDTASALSGTELVLAAKDFERMADYARDLANTVQYVMTGTRPNET